MGLVFSRYWSCCGISVVVVVGLGLVFFSLDCLFLRNIGFVVVLVSYLCHRLVGVASLWCCSHYGNGLVVILV